MLSKHSLSSYKKDIKLLSPEKIKDESMHEEIAKNLQVILQEPLRFSFNEIQNVEKE